jgi:hypothetical protein
MFSIFHPFFLLINFWDASLIYCWWTLVTGQASEAWCPPRTICCWRIVLNRGIDSDALVWLYIACIFGWLWLWNRHLFHLFLIGRSYVMLQILKILSGQ